VIKRGEVWWADLGEPGGSEPGYLRPVLILQADTFNRTQIRTVIVAALTSNLNLASAPGNVYVSSVSTGLPKDSVVNVSQIQTVNKTQCLERVGALDSTSVAAVEVGIRLVLGLR